MSTAGVFVAITSMALSIQCISGQTYCSSSSSNSLRLYNSNGNTATEGGMLQICRSNRWRAVCDYTFDCTTEGRAACRQLGYSGNQIKSAVMYNSAQYFGTWSYTDSYYYYCSTTTSSSLTSCSRSYRPSSSYCNSDDQVGLWCMTLPPTASQCTNGAVRLVGGASSNKGKLEYCHYGAWSSFCINFHDEEATVACKQLGFTGSPKAAIFNDGHFGSISNFSSFQYFSCSSSGHQSSLSSCYRYDSTCGYKCSQNYGIACYGSGHDGCRNGAVRLVNSSFEYEGRVEVCYDGVWGTVCSFDTQDAAVICRMAGFGGVMDTYSTHTMFGDGDRPIVYALYCSRCDTDIRLCSKSTYLSFSCSRGYVGGVRCFHGCTDGDIRLTGGGSKSEGTVEICHNQTWGMVSGLGWGEEDARVTCRQLQLPVEGSRYFSDSPYGKPNLTVLFSSVRCTGSESQISDCATSSLTFEEGRKLVKHIGVAGVYCKQYCPIATPTPAVVTVTQFASATMAPCPTIQCASLTMTPDPTSLNKCSTAIETVTQSFSTLFETVTQIVTSCPTRTRTGQPSQQVQSASSTDSGHVTTTFFLAGISGTLATVTVTLAVCMCYSFYKIGKMKRSISPRGQIDNQYDSQPCDVSTNPATSNVSYGKHTTTPSYGGQTLYEDIHVR